MEDKKRISVFENHYNINNLKNAFISQVSNNFVKEETYYFSNLGLDQLMRNMHSKMKGERMILRSSIPLMNEKLYYIPQSHITNKELLEYELNQEIDSLFSHLEAFSDLVYIDTASSEYSSSKVILEEADMVVVSLSQNSLILSNFFENYSFIKDKAVYLIGNYNQYSRFNLNAIINKYQIEKEKISVIPYNVEFADASAEGKMISFLSNNISCKKGDENFFFMEEVKKSRSMLNKNIDIIN
jgi:hypothetical protein